MEDIFDLKIIRKIKHVSILAWSLKLYTRVWNMGFIAIVFFTTVLNWCWYFDQIIVISVGEQKSKLLGRCILKEMFAQTW